jgi:predicted DsbA family dithiol-disulfide isomerase
VRLLDAAWSEGRDITSDTVICEIADSIGLNGQELLGKAQTIEIKERLRLQTERAIQAGVFGVPTFAICAPRWQEAFEANQAPRVVLCATHEGALAHCSLGDLKRFAVDLA